jgi:cation diffusion facilitator family transporter
VAIHNLSAWSHTHAFDAGNRAGERRTWVVVGITAVTMVVEIVAGWITGSMALLADGWHMGTHVAALSISGMAYYLARRWAADSRFAFGTWKIEVLGAFSSALVLGVVALAIVVESLVRLLHPEAISYQTALVVAVIGLVVNLASALLLQGHDHGHQHEHEHDHGHDHDHGHKEPVHHDLNMRSAHMHVLADAFTSVLAIAALLGGMLAGWTWLDPAMGIVGAAVIAWWAKGLLVDSARVLLDREMDSPVVGQIRKALQIDGDAEIADLHVWRVGRTGHAAVLTVVADRPLTPDHYRERLAGIDTLVHVSIEVNRCPHQNCGPDG